MSTTSKKVKPQLKEKKIDPMQPRNTKKRAITFLDHLRNIGESCITVAHASSIEKLESIPKVNRVTARIKAQKLGAGIVSMAAG